ncbi:MAG: sugar phosphate isomerase/epimerase [Victivallales bacterium]|nr:sugar phosphate isomerase/epimerase [Victivallales bacterium]
MYKALNYWVFGGFGGEKSPFEFIEWAEKQGLDGVELTVGDAIKEDISKEECRRIADFAGEKGIGLRTIATGFYWGKSLGSPDEGERSAAIDFTRKYLHVASWLGAESVLVVPGATRVAWDASRPVVPYQTVWDQSTKSLLELERLAEELKTDIALENVWGRFLFSPVEWRFYLDQFKSGKIGMYFDVGNCCLYVRPQDYVEILGSRIKAVHVKNWRGDALAGGNLHGFGEDIMDGEVDFKEVCNALSEVGYNGPLTAEMIPFSRLPDLAIPDIGLATATAERMKLI